MVSPRIRAFAGGILGLMALALPETGWFGPEFARLIVVLGAGAFILLFGSALWAWISPRVIPRLPVAFQSPITRRDARMPRPEGELGFLDFKAVAEDAIDDMSGTFARMSKDMIGSAKVMKHYTPRMEGAVNASGQDQRRLVQEFVRKHTPYVERLEINEKLLNASAGDFDENFPRWLKAVKHDGVLALKGSVADLRKATVGAKDSVVAYQGAVKEQRAQNMQQDLNAMLDWTLEIVDRIIEDEDIVIGTADAVLGEIASRESASRATRRSPRTSKRGLRGPPPSPGSEDTGP